MATGQMNSVIEHLRNVILRHEDAEPTDGELLGCFLDHNDDTAFAALVRRHGAMVWGVCRRVLGSHHDAEDAFQATFLVLMRKGHTVRPRGMVVNWLYGVAYHTALKARMTAGKRKTRERQVTEMPEPSTTTAALWDDLQPLLDQELSRLPDKYRAAIILCDVEGKSRKEGSRQLGIKEGTLSSRLTTARTLLANRLARRGLALSGGLIASMLSQNAASASAPASAVSSTITTAGLLAAGKATTGAVSASVAALAEGVMKSMLLLKLKAVALALVVGSLLTLGGVWAASGQPGKADGVQPLPQDTKKPADQPKKDDTKKEEPKKADSDKQPVPMPMPVPMPNPVVRPDMGRPENPAPGAALPELKRFIQVRGTWGKDGFLITAVKMDGPALRLTSPDGKTMGQIHPGDAITKVGGQKVESQLDYIKAMNAAADPNKIEIEVRDRAGKVQKWVAGSKSSPFAN